MQKEQMNAMVAKGYGGPEVFELKQVDKPLPYANEVLVKVQASAVTAADTMMRKGKPYFGRLMTGLRKPKNPIPGTGFAGIIEAVGTDVTTWKKGMAVFGETTLGFSANAEYLTLNKEDVFLTIPEGLSFGAAATFCDGHLTSYNFLKEIAAIKKGDKVLINGASGSLGTAGIQIAKYLGAEVTAVCSGKNTALVKSLGADFTVDYTQKDFTQTNQKYDWVYDTVGKSSFKKCKNILSPTGTYLSPVLQFSLLIDMLRTAKSKGKKAVFQATGLNKSPQLKKMLNEVVSIYKSGNLKTHIDRQFPLPKLAEAHRYVDAGHKKGNVVLIHA